MESWNWMRRPVSIVTVLAWCSVTAHAGVIVVAQDGSGDATQINQAILLASDGDTLLVRSGTYAPFVVPNLALEIVADEGASVAIHGYCAVTGLAADKTVLLSGLTAVAQLPVHYGLYLQGNQGSVRVLDCNFAGYAAPEQGCEEFGDTEPGGDAVYVDHCNDVAMTTCTVVGGDASDSDSYYCLDTGGKGGHGVYVSSSSVTLYDCGVTGGAGGTSGYGGFGGAGVWLVASELFAAGRKLQGGDAGDTNDVIWICGDGGPGVYADASSIARILDVVLEGGEEGYPYGCGNDGAPFDGSGTLTSYSGTLRRLNAGRVVREGSVIQLVFRGTPGDSVLLCRSHAADARHIAPFRGTLLLGPPLAVTFVGTIATDGTLTVSLPPATLPAGIESELLHFQGLFSNAIDGRLLGSPTHLLVVDSVF
jgi:hypothetical protein